MGAAVVAQGELQNVLEEVGAHHLILPVRQPIGMKRYHRAGSDGKEGKSSPCSE